MHEDVAGEVHPVELHELVHQLERDRPFQRLVDLLAQRVLPEKCRAPSFAALLVFDDLEHGRADLRAQLGQHAVRLEALDHDVLEVVDLLHEDI